MSVDSLRHLEEHLRRIYESTKVVPRSYEEALYKLEVEQLTFDALRALEEVA